MCNYCELVRCEYWFVYKIDTPFAVTVGAVFFSAVRIDRIILVAALFFLSCIHCCIMLVFL